MVLRIRFRPSAGSPLEASRRRQIALAISALLSPAAVVALALAFWRLGADLNLTGRFVISDGLFSHWQAWLALAAGLEAGASLLSRYARASGSATQPQKAYNGRDQATP